MASEVFPTPGFEGAEKRLELDFSGEASSAGAGAGLRALPRPALDEMLALAACEIVSVRSNAFFDAYVLSESSLFVYPEKMVLKTCGTTQLLSALPKAVALAADLGMELQRCKYSRGRFLFPEHQPEVYQSWKAEVEVLKETVGHLGNGGGSYVLGDACEGSLWHVFCADARGVKFGAANPTYTLEVCMTELDPVKAAQFTRGKDFVSAAATTNSTGIRALCPNADIDDYVFEPCGYSMNALQGPGAITIHVTPEDGFSYASVEFTSFNPADICPEELVAGAAAIFGARRVCVALSSDDAAAPDLAWAAGLQSPPAGYAATCASAQELAPGGRVWWHCLAPIAPRPISGMPAAAAAELAPVATAAAAKKRAPDSPVSRPTSPASVLAHWPSFASTVGDVGRTLSSTLFSRSRSPTSPPSSDGSRTASRRASVQLARGAGGMSTGIDIERGFSGPAPAPGPAPLCAVLARHSVAHLPIAATGEESAAAAYDAYAARLVAERALEESFYVLDLGAVASLHAHWCDAMPRVRPFYAVKCNTDGALLGTLAALGCGFDCATEYELEACLALGVAPRDIILANACKRPSDVRAAAARGVARTTFDTACELAKLARLHPGADAILRIRADDPDARCQLGNKYGAEEEDIVPLLEEARRLGVRVGGVSFHVGSGATNPAAFSAAIAAAAGAFAAGIAAGHPMRLLDIGGGFVAASVDGDVQLGGVPAAVNAALDEHFPEESSVEVIAEPGRYFAEDPATMYAAVFGRRVPKTDASRQDVWITDGLYGSFNSILYDHATISSRALKIKGAGSSATADNAAGEPTLTTTVFGPTCDGLDTVLRDTQLPQLACGDWLAFPNMGAYTLAGASHFNGIDAVHVDTYYVWGAPTPLAV